MWTMLFCRRVAERLSPQNGLIPFTDDLPCLRTVFSLLMASALHPWPWTMDCFFSCMGKQQGTRCNKQWTVFACRGQQMCLLQWIMDCHFAGDTWHCSAMHIYELPSKKLPGNGLALSWWQNGSPRILRTVLCLNACRCLLVVKIEVLALRFAGECYGAQRRLFLRLVQPLQLSIRWPIIWYS